MSTLDFKDNQGFYHRFCSECKLEVDLLGEFFRVEGEGDRKYYHPECMRIQVTHFQGTSSK